MLVMHSLSGIFGVGDGWLVGCDFMGIDLMSFSPCSFPDYCVGRMGRLYCVSDGESCYTYLC